ncbi:MAG: cytochrome c [Sphingobium sp.]|nr:cytochrome c [Sphingobium sp.]
MVGTLAVLSACMLPSSEAVSQPAPVPVPASNPTAAATIPAAAAAAGAAALDQTRVAAGRELFGSWGCTACHTLADAHSNGAVGPSLDGNASLTEDFITSRVTNGQGAMPAFGGQLSPKEVADVAYYIAHVAKK